MILHNRFWRGMDQFRLFHTIAEGCPYCRIISIRPFEYLFATRSHSSVSDDRTNQASSVPHLGEPFTRPMIITTRTPWGRCYTQALPAGFTWLSLDSCTPDWAIKIPMHLYLLLAEGFPQRIIIKLTSVLILPLGPL
jgi:hypothetical protein